MVGVGTADEHRGLAACAAGLDDVEARHLPESVWRGANLLGLKQVGGEYGDARPVCVTGVGTPVADTEISASGMTASPPRDASANGAATCWACAAGAASSA